MITAIYKVNSTGELELIIRDSKAGVEDNYLTFFEEDGQTDYLVCMKNEYNNLDRWEYQSWTNGKRDAVDNNALFVIAPDISEESTRKHGVFVPDYFTTVFPNFFKNVFSIISTQYYPGEKCFSRAYTSKLVSTDAPNSSAEHSDEPAAVLPNPIITNYYLTHESDEGSYMLDDFKDKAHAKPLKGLKAWKHRFFAKDIPTLITVAAKNDINVNGMWYFDSNDKNIPKRYFTYDVVEDKVEEKNAEEIAVAEKRIHPQAILDIKKELKALFPDQRPDAYYAIVGAAKTLEIAMDNKPNGQDDIKLLGIASGIENAIRVTNACLFAADRYNELGENDDRKFGAAENLIQKYLDAKNTICQLSLLDEGIPATSLAKGVPIIVVSGLLGALAGVIMYAAIYATIGAALGLGIGAVPGLFIGIIHGIIQGVFFNAAMFGALAGGTSMAAAATAGLTLYAAPSKVEYMIEAVSDELTEILSRDKVKDTLAEVGAPRLVI